MTTPTTQTGTTEPVLVPLNLIFDYPVRWPQFKVLRDLIQNCYDSVGYRHWHSRFSYQWTEGRLRLTTARTGFSYDWLLHIGASTKRGRAGEYAGYFGEGFKIAALCALRDHGWSLAVASRDWRLEVTTAEVIIDGRRLTSLAYRVWSGLPVREDTVLWLSPFSECDQEVLECALLSFYYEENPLLGERIWASSSAAIWKRSSRGKPAGYPATYDDRGPGIVFAGYQALGSFGLPLVFCAHGYRHSDRERNSFYQMDVVNAVRETVGQLPPDAARAVLVRLQHLWYRYPRKRYDFESWYHIVHSLARTVAASPEHAAAWRERYPHLLVASRVRKKNLREHNRRRQALDWLRRHRDRYRLVQDGFTAFGYPTLELACEAAGGFSVTRPPQPGMERRLIGLLAESVHALCGDFFGPGGLPPGEIIEDERAVWMGMAVCIARRTALKNPEGLAIRFDLPFVALKPSLLQPGRGGEALRTYLHELTHIFGGDRSPAFSAALTALLDRVLLRHREIAHFERAWDLCFENPAEAMDDARHGRIRGE